jgi:hypothetical protein
VRCLGAEIVGEGRSLMLFWVLSLGVMGCYMGDYERDMKVFFGFFE